MIHLSRIPKICSVITDDFDHFATPHPTRNLLVRGVGSDDNKFDKIYKPARNATITDEDIKVSIIQLRVDKSFPCCI